MMPSQATRWGCPARSAGSSAALRITDVSGPDRTTVVCSLGTEPRVSAIFRYDSFVEITRSAARKVRRSSQ